MILRMLIRPLIILISIVTVLSGLMQIINPRFVLSFIGGTIGTTERQLFATIGMFMLLFGLMMLHAVYACDDNRVAVFWSAMQKVGAAVAVLVAVVNEVFGRMALGLALFDFISGVLFLIYLRIIRDSHGFDESNL